VCDGTLGTIVTKISWAPTTSYNRSGTSNITLLTLSSDFSARLISFSEGGTQVTSLGGTSGHRSFINDVDCIIHPNLSEVSTPTNENLVIATAGDDNTLIIWQTNESGLVPIAYSLTSPGVSVDFCKHFSRRLLVAEEKGIIRLLDWLASDDVRASSSGGGSSTLWLLNIHMGVGLSNGIGSFLASAEWCAGDIDKEFGRIVAVTKGGEWAVWDLSRIEGAGRTVPVEKGQIIQASHVISIRYVA
jgi:WD40 repeat protein